jgi:D-sedoheptulose 7-phosphate isomerase
VRVHEALARECAEAIAEAAARIAGALAAGGRLLVFGNGGSAAEALHIADELVGRYQRERPALSAVALCANVADLTAIANDSGFEEVFARQIEAHGRPGDVALGISTSGRSPNVVLALQRARDRGLETVALTGGDGGELRACADTAIVVPSIVTARIQEAHATIGHVLCVEIEDAVHPQVSRT